MTQKIEKTTKNKKFFAVLSENPRVLCQSATLASFCIPTGQFFICLKLCFKKSHKSI